MRLVENGYKYAVELIETIENIYPKYERMINESVSSKSNISPEEKREFIKNLAPILESYITLVANVIRPKGAADVIEENITKNKEEIEKSFNNFILSVYKYVDENNKIPFGFHLDFVNLIEEACKKNKKSKGTKPSKKQTQEIMNETIKLVKQHSHTIYENFVKNHLSDISIDVERNLLETTNDNEQPKDFYKLVEQKIGAEFFKNLILEFVFGGVYTKKLNDNKNNLNELEKQVYETAQKLSETISKIIF